MNVKRDHKHQTLVAKKTWKQQHPRSHSKLFMTIPRSRSGRYFGASMGMSMEEQFQRISAKVFWQVFLTSRAAWIMVCMSSRLLRHSWAWEDTMPGSSLQCWVWFMCRDAGACDSDLQGGKHKHNTSIDQCGLYNTYYFDCGGDDNNVMIA